MRIIIATWVLLRLCVKSLKSESYEAIRFLVEGDSKKKMNKKNENRKEMVLTSVR